MKRKTTKRRLLEGLPVIDSTRNLRIEILPADVKKSKKGRPDACAAAVACQRKYHTEVRVFLTKTYVKQRNHWIRFHTPERISREIIAFDRGSTFEPGIYEVKAPRGAQRLGTWVQTGPKNKKNRTVNSYNMTKNVRNFRERVK